MNTEVVRILEQARAKLAAPNGWIQGTFARDIFGKYVESHDIAAVCFCGSGAIRSMINDSCYNDVRDASRFVKQAISTKYKYTLIWSFNDAPGRTVEEVLEVFDDAIKLAKEAE